MKKYSVIINADMGESFGQYKMGQDEELFKYVTSGNMACGFHAGDPTVMKNSVASAKEHNVSVGAHPGLPDLFGFGRRRIDVTAEELYNDVVYQLGALEAFTKVEKVTMTHVCVHGVMDPMVSNEEIYCDAFLKAIKDYNKDLVIVAESKSLLYERGKSEGLKLAAVAYPDLRYDDDGNIMIERDKKPMDPQEVARQAISIVKENKLLTVGGKEFEVKADVLGFHGDQDNIVEILTTVRKALVEAGIEIRSF